MVKEKPLLRRCAGIALLALICLASVSRAESSADQNGQGGGGTAVPMPYGFGMMPQQPANTDAIEKWDKRVFDVDRGAIEPETRTSPRGNTRYLDKTKELNSNVEQEERWRANCASLKETDMKAFRDCVAAQKEKELGGRTNFGTRDFRANPKETQTVQPPPRPSFLDTPQRRGSGSDWEESDGN